MKTTVGQINGPILIRWISASLAFGISSLALAYGGSVSNGGDVIRCFASPAAFPVASLYSLDYVIARQRHPTANFAPVPSWDESVLRISKILAKGNSHLAHSFADFVAGLQNPVPGVPVPKRSWSFFDWKYVGPELSEDYLGALPANCPREIQEDPTFRVRRSIVRVKDDESILYIYDARVLPILLRDFPQQASFLLVHEWLWDFTPDIDRLREINSAIHSAKFETLTAEQINTLFGAK